MGARSRSWRPRLNSRCVLKGPYPEVIDISEANPLEPDLSDPRVLISGDTTVRKIIAPSDQSGISFLSVNDLPALEEIMITGGERDYPGCLRWLEINNCPSLRRVFAEGGIISLTVRGHAALELLDISGCQDIDYVCIQYPVPELRICAKGCFKLRRVVGLGEEAAVSCGLVEQIAENQTSSRRDGVIRDAMTFTDIDLVLSSINSGLKALSRQGLLVTSGTGEAGFSMTGAYGARALQEEFKPFCCRVLRPLENAYSGGTGEICVYLLMESRVRPDTGGYTECALLGTTSQEACLRAILDRHDMSIEALQSAAESGPTDKILGFPVKLSPLICERKRGELEELIEICKLRIATAETRSFGYVVEDMDSPGDDDPDLLSADFVIDASTALSQIKALLADRHPS